MCYMITYNLEINVIYVCSKEFKITQFATDTTLFLDGSQNSLQAAINTIKLFGSFSRLKMNTNKTKVVWIGRKKHIVEKLNVNCKLDWNMPLFHQRIKPRSCRRPLIVHSRLKKDKNGREYWVGFKVWD